MCGSLHDPNDHGLRHFAEIAATFLADPGLPFVQLLSAERIERVFRKHGNLFGLHTVYSTAMMVWSFLGQVLRDGKEASCQAAVSRVIVHQQQSGGNVPTRGGTKGELKGTLLISTIRGGAIPPHPVISLSLGTRGRTADFRPFVPGRLGSHTVPVGGRAAIHAFANVGNRRHSHRPHSRAINQLVFGVRPRNVRRLFVAANDGCVQRKQL